MMALAKEAVVLPPLIICRSLKCTIRVLSAENETERATTAIPLLKVKKFRMIYDSISNYFVDFSSYT